jgi:asparagine synthase (glutamine-hydrolysing)
VLREEIMAGLVGYIGENIKNEGSNLLASMSQAIKYVTGDIVDSWQDKDLALSRVHHGVVNREKQPIFNEDKSLLIFMDGEVYGYEADKQFLLNKGHSFRYTHNDAEFCLHLYEELGEAAFKKLNGSFLIALYNLRTQELILVNDRFSSRSLFYYETVGSLIFGAQLKAIIQSAHVPRNLNLQAIFEFFTFQRVLGAKTYYKDIKIMPPATFLKFQQAKIRFKQYWEMNFQEGKGRSKKYYIDAFVDAFKTAVQRRTCDDHRYGILLSGGLDSRAVLAALNRQITAFTLADFENNELKIAKEIAATTGCKHFFLKRELDHYPKIIDKSVEMGDGMFNFQHAHFTGFLNNISKETDILLHGYAFDILYKGCYLPTRKLHLFGKTITFPIMGKLSDKTLLQSILKSRNSLWDEEPDRLFAKDLSRDFKHRLKESVAAILNESSNHANDCYNKFDYFETHFPFKHFSFLNKLCIAHFMDERTIAYDNDLFNLYLEMPVELRFNAFTFKRALKKLNLKLAKIPNANTGLSSTVPVPLEWGIMLAHRFREKIFRPHISNPAFTQGSWPKLPELIRHNEKLKQCIWSVIHDEECIDSTIFNRSTLIDIFNKHLNYRADFTEFLLLTLTFGTWHKKYGPGK